MVHSIKSIKSMKTIETLNNAKIDELFLFLLDKNNFKNKMDVNTVFWDLIYLRKLLHKSIKSRRSSKKQLTRNIVLLDDNTIIGCVSYKYLLDIDHLALALWDLTIIIKPEYYNVSLNALLIKYFRENNDIQNVSANSILAVYMPVNNHKINTIFHNELSIDTSTNTDCFVFGIEDNITYQDKYNIYYNFQSSEKINANAAISSRQIITTITTITTSCIISLLLNGYNLDNLIQRQTDISRISRLTKKRMSVPEIKIITKNLYDIKEIQNLPEYQYDFFKIYSFKYTFIFEYLINRNMSHNDFIMKRFFSGSLLYNENLYKIYSKILNTAIDNIRLDNLKDKILNINYVIKNNFFFVYEIENALLYNLIGKYHNRLIISNNYSNIKYFSIYKNNIISIKQFSNSKERDNEINKISDKIIISRDFNNLQNILAQKAKYDCILIDILYANFDYILGNINLICKAQTIIFTVCNALLRLNKQGNIVINLREGYIDTPIFKKLLTILCGLFKTNDFIGLYSINRICITFNKFIGLDDKNKKIIESLITESKKYENTEINQNDMIQLLVSNKFNYQMNAPEQTLQPVKPMHILYDIDGISIKEKIIKNIMDKYYLHLKQQRHINAQIRNFYIETNSNFKDSGKIIRLIYLYIFENIKKYNIIDIESIDNLIKIFKT